VGGAGCQAFDWDSARDAYQPIELGSQGDFRVENAARAAVDLTHWLLSIQRALTE
jgi:hypothetical protein